MADTMEMGTRIITPGSEDIPSLATLPSPALTAPTAETPPPRPPTGVELPSWDEIKQTDVFKKADDAQKGVILKNYASEVQNFLGQRTPQAQHDINNWVNDFYNQEQETIGPHYNFLENEMRSFFGQGVVRGTAALGRETTARIQDVLRGQEKVAPGVITTQSDIRGKPVDQANAELQQQLELKKDIDSKLPAAERFRTTVDSVGVDPEERAKAAAAAPDAEMFPGGYDQASQILRSPGFINQRISLLQKYIASGGDPNSVPANEPDPTKPWRKAETWITQNLAPDKAFSRQYAFLDHTLSGLGYTIPFLAERAGVIAVSGALGAGPEAVQALGNLADGALQIVDIYSQAYDRALAKIDDRVKAGEAISPEQKEWMARDDAAMSLFNVPFMVFSNMLAGRIMEGSGITREAAQGVVNQFTKNVLVPGIKDTAIQTGIGTGTAVWSALSDQMSGVSTEPINWGEALTQGAAMGAGMGALQGLGRAYHLYIGDNQRVNNLADTIRANGDSLLKINPDLNRDDVHEFFVSHLPADQQDSVRARLGLKKAADIQRETSDELAKTGSPLTKEEVDKGIVETEQQSTAPPKPQPMTPERRMAAGEDAINQALANGQINAAQHAELVAHLEENPGETIEQLGGLLGIKPEHISLDRIREVTRIPAEAVKKPEVTPPPPAPEVTPAPEVAPKEVTPPAPAPEEVTPPAPAPEVSPHHALLTKVSDYLGPEAMGGKEEKLEFGRDFLASVPEGDRPAAAQLVHRLHLEELPEGEHENWTKIPVEQRDRMMALMSRFVDNRIAAEGRQAEKPIFKKAMTYGDLLGFYHEDDAEGLNSLLRAGQIMTMKEENFDPGGPLEMWLDNNRFTADPVEGTDKIIIGSSDLVKTIREQAEERYRKVKESEPKRPPGKPLRETYTVPEHDPAYLEATASLPEHPAENEELEQAIPKIAKSFPSDETGLLSSAATERFRRQLRLWAKRMVDAGRNEDMVLLGKRSALENELSKYDKDSPYYTAIDEALKLTDTEIEKTDAEKPVVETKKNKKGETVQVEHKHPKIGPIIEDINNDYQRWKKRRAEKYEEISLQKPVGEEGETELGEILGAYQHEPALEGRTLTAADENIGPVHQFLDVDQEPAVADYTKQLRTKEEKSYAYFAANRLATIYGRPEVEPPADLPKVPNHYSKQLLDRIFYEYTRFLERRDRESRPAGEGGEAGREAAAGAPGGGGVPPAYTEKAFPAYRPEYPAGGLPPNRPAFGQPSALTTGYQGNVAERNFAPGQYREFIAGYPERTTEDETRPVGRAALLGPSPGAAAGAGAEEAITGAGGAAAARAGLPAAVTGERIPIAPGGPERVSPAVPAVAATPQVRLFTASRELADNLGRYFFKNQDVARRYGARFEGATTGEDLGNRLMAKLKTRFGNNVPAIHETLRQIATREGLIPPKEYTLPEAVPGSKTLYAGKMDSLSPGIGEEHVLNEGKAEDLARYFRYSPDPEMREFAKSLTTNREKLMPVVLRQLNHNVPAVFYHDGDIFVTRAALDHLDGHKALAHELQHAIAQEVLTNPIHPEDHEAAAHALALRDEFRTKLPADIRDAADHKLPELLDHTDASGHLDVNQLTDEEKRWLPLMEASLNPSEFIKKAFSSANFRDFLRNTRSDRGDSMWDKVNDWGRTLFGRQAFKYAPEVSDITYNRPGAVMRADPRTRNLEFDPLSPKQTLTVRLRGTSAHIEDELRTMDPDFQKEFNSFTDPLKAYEAGNLKLTPKLLGLLRRQEELKTLLARPEPPNPYKEIRDKYGFDQGAAHVLNRINELSADPYHRLLARSLVNSLLGTNIKVIIDDQAGAAYDFTKDRIRVSKEGLLKGATLDRAILHESVHALVSGKISAYLTGRMDLLTPEEKSAVSELEKLRLLAVDWGIKNGHIPSDFRTIVNAGGYINRSDLFNALAKTNKSLTDFYGLFDTNEFASEALTNSALQKYLDKIPYKEEGKKAGYTMWGKFIDWTKRMLGFKPGGTALSAALNNVVKLSEGQRLIHSDFHIDGVTGPKTSRMAALLARSDFLERKATAEGYPNLGAVPTNKLNAWAQNYMSETMYTGEFSPRAWDGFIAPPKTKSMLLPSKELAQKTTPEDIVDHIAEATGTNHLDSGSLRKAVNQAYKDGALAPHQFIGTQDFLSDLDNRTLRHFNPLAWATGSRKDDPWSPWSQLKSWGRQWLAKGDLPEEILKLKLHYIDDANNEMEYRGRLWWKRFDQILKQNYGDIKDVRFVPARTMDQLNDVLAGKYKTMPKGMPLDMWNHIKSGRVMLDLQSQALLRDLGVAPDSDLYIRIERGLGAQPGEGLTIAPGHGTYVHSAYQIFDDPRYRLDQNVRDQYWSTAIGPVKDHWIDVQSHEAGDKAARVYRPGTTAYDDAHVRAYWSRRNRLEDTTTNAQVEQHMEELLHGYSQAADMMRQPAKTVGPMFMLNDKILTELTHLPKEFKLLMGQERDIRTNFINTLLKQNRLLNAIQLGKAMLEEGKGKWFSDTLDTTRGLTFRISPEVAYVRMMGAAPEEEVQKHSIFGPLAGKYTTKEIHAVLSGYDKLVRQDPPHILLRLMYQAENTARYSTTILSAHRGVGNIPSSAFAMMQNGMLPLDPAAGRATMTYIRDLFGSTDEGIENRIAEAKRYGVLDKNEDHSLLNEQIRRGAKYTEYGRGPLDMLEAVSESALKNPAWSGAKLTVQKAKEFALKFHTGANDISKMAQWEVKQHFLRDADNKAAEMAADARKLDPSLPEFVPKTDEQIKREAAWIVRKTNIAYSMVSPAIKAARTVPLVGTFISYWSQMVSTYANQIAYAIKYLSSKNPVEFQEGVRRAAGLIAGLSLPYAAMMASMARFGVTSKQDNNLKKLLPPWEQNDMRLYLHKEKDGRLVYMNLNYIMPQGDLARGLIAMLTPNRNGTFGNVLDSLNEVTHPMINIGLMPGALIDIGRNQTEYGTQVYNPEEDLLHQGGAVLNHMMGRWIGGTIGRAFNQLPQLGKVSPGGNVYDPYVLAGREILGQDIHYISMPDRFRSSLFSSQDDIKNAQKIFTGPVQHTNNEMTDEQMQQLYLHMEKARFLTFQRLHDKVEAALDSGMDLKAVKAALKERGYSRRLANDLLAGRYRSYRPGKTVLANAKANGNIVPRSLFSSSAIDYDEEGE